MKVFKFGGASIKDAQSIQNMADIIRSYHGEDIVIVVSAMGKTTNQLEYMFHKIVSNEECKIEFSHLVSYHESIISELFKKDASRINQKTGVIFNEIRSLNNDYSKYNSEDQFYDALVSFGEIISSLIIAEYLTLSGITITWVDARKLIVTDQTFREGKIEWDITTKNILDTIGTLLMKNPVITQGFLGATNKGETTTLGREGSDFSAAILAYSLNAESVTIWKDVPGILNADPKRFNDTELYHNLSYQEAAEMTYYGASVIHPKTIKPLANKNIPLLVKSFERPTLSGTVINKGTSHALPPTYVIKDNQSLISFGVKDLTFINEKNLSIIFHILDKLNIKINMMQNSAVTFTICIDNRRDKVLKLVDILKNDFKILYNENLQLVTIKNYDQKAIEKVTSSKDVLVEQRTRNTYQIVVK